MICPRCGSDLILKDKKRHCPRCGYEIGLASGSEGVYSLYVSGGNIPETLKGSSAKKGRKMQLRFHFSKLNIFFSALFVVALIFFIYIVHHPRTHPVPVQKVAATTINAPGNSKLPAPATGTGIIYFIHSLDSIGAYDSATKQASIIYTLPLAFEDSGSITGLQSTDNGSRIAFTYTPNSATAAGVQSGSCIFLLATDGNNAIPFTPGCSADGASDSDSLPTFSSTGSELYFYSAGRSENPGIFRASLSTGTVSEVLSLSAINVTMSSQIAPSSLAISPDGSKLALPYYANGASVPTLFTVGANGEALSSPNPSLQVASVEGWSPDGSRLLIIEGQGANELVTVNPQTAMPITTILKTQSGTQVITNASWSPDGTLIAYVVPQAGQYMLYSIGSDGQTRSELLQTQTYPASPSWTTSTTIEPGGTPITN
jgi:hypothetical protein